MMEDEWAHVALLSALTHVDDTALLAKMLLPAVTVLHCPSSCYAGLSKQVLPYSHQCVPCRSTWLKQQSTDMAAASCFSSWIRTARGTCLRTCMRFCTPRSQLQLR